MSSPNQKLIIIGSGPAALGVAEALSRSGQSDFRIFEKEKCPGGLMRSMQIDNFIFDWAGHIFFTAIPQIKAWIEKLMEGNFHWQDRESWIYSKKTYTRYPFQANTYGLPVNVVKECLIGLIEATYVQRDIIPHNFKDWILNTYGSGIARHFMFPYNEKLWARDLVHMEYSWLDGRVPKPGLDEFIDGALQLGRKDMGPNARFGYPLIGGMSSLVSELCRPLKDQIHLNQEVVAIDTKNKSVTLASGTVQSFDQLVFTGPLPELVKMTQSIPEEIKKSVLSLDSLSVCCVNVGINRPATTEKHWIYFPEQEYIFHRIFVQGNASPSVCPPDCFSFTAEITAGGNKRLDLSSVIDLTVDGMIRCGLIPDRKDIRVSNMIFIPYGYVVPAVQNAEIVQTAKAWFTEHDIFLCGRFAEWAYYNMDHSLHAGLRLGSQLTGIPLNEI